MAQLLPDEVSSIPGTHVKAGDSQLYGYTHMYLNSHISYTHIHAHIIIIKFKKRTT